MSVNITTVAEDFSVAPQLQASDLADIARQGFRSVINNRPDGEGGPDQPRSDELRAAAEAAGLTYAALPIPPSGFGDEPVARMRELLAALPKPVLAFCRTGTRSTTLYRRAGTDAERTS
jgi:uncharacterized protein (TIGR01244 family)